MSSKGAGGKQEWQGLAYQTCADDAWVCASLKVCFGNELLSIDSAMKLLSNNKAFTQYKSKTIG
jgi:hypothetical protein